MLGTWVFGLGNPTEPTLPFRLIVNIVNSSHEGDLEIRGTCIDSYGDIKRGFFMGTLSEVFLFN